MAHIPDGLLSLPVLVGGGVLAAAGIGIGLRHLDEARLARGAILSAVFFSASLVSVPVGPSSVHLLLTVLMGLVLGPAIFPAVFVALVLQVLMFGFGGLSTLGVNTLNIALPGALVGALLRPLVDRSGPRGAGALAGAGAALATAMTAGGVALALALSASAYVPSARVLGLTYLPLMLGEALVTGFAVAFLKRVRPETFRPGLGLA
ncbi:cobalt transporter CbiM (plasmid) [Paroceanicella profunda]|uniref:Cobalt transporter CbiM n=1 Tax=Paroceanicella profunda TaxID=2579971 RepID=A0A5B8G4Q2_9RHOB|nr:cobalt transporter CbiM [Paroceanicella profunda]QDL93943.1 cobalt transporter CbiM [Paroceanicella profunda]